MLESGKKKKKCWWGLKGNKTILSLMCVKSKVFSGGFDYEKLLFIKGEAKLKDTILHPHIPTSVSLLITFYCCILKDCVENVFLIHWLESWTWHVDHFPVQTYWKKRELSVSVTKKPLCSVHLRSANEEMLKNLGEKEEKENEWRRGKRRNKRGWQKKPSE